MEDLKEFFKPEVIWLIAGVIMLVMEFALPGLIIFFFGIGACIVALICLLFDLSLNGQLLIFILSSVILLVSLRKWLKKAFMGRIALKTEQDETREEFIGKSAIVKKEITTNIKGKVEFHGTLWTAEADEDIPVGTPVEIIGKDNITLKVKPI